MREQTFQVGGNTYRNVIADLGPNTHRRIVVGAHYDAVESTPGADDNASAVAGLLELAAVMSDDPLPIRVELVAFTLEEPPHFGTNEMGSAHHAAQLASEDTEVVAMICLEMIGYYDERPGSQTFPVPGMQLVYGTKGDFISVVGRTDQIQLVDRVTEAMRKAAPLRVAKICRPIARDRHRLLRSPQLLAARHAGGHDHRHRFLSQRPVPSGRGHDGSARL